MIDQAFHVLTEFRFEAGSAIAESKGLQKAVEGVSNAADQALFSFQKLSGGIVAQMGLATGSLLTLLGASIQASDKFGMSQRKLANIFLSNPDKIAGGAVSFLDAMTASASIMGEIQRKAAEFALPAQQLLDTTAQIAPVLFNQGAAGTNLHGAVDMSRQFLKSAPVLGIDPGMATSQLTSAIMGRATFQDTLFQRLSAETGSMKPYSGHGGAQAFNLLPDKKRVEVLTAALRQFSSSADVLKGNAMSLTGEFQRLTDTLKGTFSILRPIGDALIGPITQTMHHVTNYLQKSGFEISTQIGNMIKTMVEDPQNLIVNLMQLRKLKSNTLTAGKILEVIGLGLFVREILGFSSVARAAFAGISIGLRALGSGVTFIWGLIGGFMGFFKILNLGTKLLSTILVPFLLLTGLLQLFSRAIAIARISDAKDVVEKAPEMVAAIAKVKTVFGTLMEPFNIFFDMVANAIAPLFKFSYYADFAVFLLNKFADGLILVQAGLLGAIAVVQKFMSMIDITGRGGGGGFSVGALGKSWNDTVDSVIEENMRRVQNGSAIVNQVTNIAKVEIKNQFKDNMEPDRIAFTIQEQLLKAARNPPQGRVGSLQGVGAGN